MSGRIVRTVTKAKDVTKLADHVTSDNDIISDVDGNIYLKQGVKNYVKLSTSNDSESLQSELTSVKSENTKLKKRIEALETSNKDLISRVEALENADTSE